MTTSAHNHGDSGSVVEKLLSGEWPTHQAVPPQKFYEDMIDGGWFVLTPDGIEASEAYRKYDDGSPAT